MRLKKLSLRYKGYHFTLFGCSGYLWLNNSPGDNITFRGIMRIRVYIELEVECPACSKKVRNASYVAAALISALQEQSLKRTAKC